MRFSGSVPDPRILFLFLADASIEAGEGERRDQLKHEIAFAPISLIF
jgi:hypothetical protein